MWGGLEPHQKPYIFWSALRNPANRQRSVLYPTTVQGLLEFIHPRYPPKSSTYLQIINSQTFRCRRRITYNSKKMSSLDIYQTPLSERYASKLHLPK